MHLPPKARSWIVISPAAGPFLVLSMGPSHCVQPSPATRSACIRDGVRYLKQEQRGDGMWLTYRAIPAPEPPAW